MLFWVGGYSADLPAMGGQSSGIGTLTAGAVDTAWASGTLSFGRLATRAPSPSPSWLAAHPTLDVVYAAHEGAGAVAAYERTDVLRLRPLGRSLHVGDSPCHIAVAPDGTFLVVTCYGDGRVVRVSLQPDGALGGAIVVTDDVIRDPHSGSGSGELDADDQDFFAAAGVRDLRALAAALAEDSRAAAEASEPRDAEGDVAGASPVPAEPSRVSRAHATAFLPDGRIATTDLGFDTVCIWRAGPHTLRLDHVVTLPKGSGPRHMVVHPSGHLHVVTEYSCEVFTLAPRTDGRWGVIAATPVSADANVGFDFPAELSVDRQGDFLYAGVRGSDAIATLRVRGAGERIEAVALVESGGEWPRHHLLAHDTLLVANQLSGEVTSLPISERTGVPGRARHRSEAGSPSCLLEARAS